MLKSWAGLRRKKKITSSLEKTLYCRDLGSQTVNFSKRKLRGDVSLQSTKYIKVVFGRRQLLKAMPIVEEESFLNSINSQLQKLGKLW